MPNLHLVSDIYSPLYVFIFIIFFKRQYNILIKKKTKFSPYKFHSFRYISLINISYRINIQTEKTFKQKNKTNKIKFRPKNKTELYTFPWNIRNISTYSYEMHTHTYI